MTNITDQVDAVFNGVNTILTKFWELPPLPSIAIMVWIIGLFLRYQKWCPNNVIPVVVVFSAVVMKAAIADPRADSVQVNGWTVKNMFFGACIGMLVWLFHNFMLKPLVRKNEFTRLWFGWLAPSNGDTVPDVKPELKSTVTSGKENLP